MLPAYTLTVDIEAKDLPIDEKEFRELIAPCLSYLDALKGAFDKRPCVAQFYQPENSIGWSVRCILMISLGKQRAEYLVQLYRAIARLITLELPDYLYIRVEVDKFQFS